MCDFTYIEVASIKRYRNIKNNWYNRTYIENNGGVILHIDKTQKLIWYVWFNIYMLCKKTYDKNWGGNNEII